LSADHGLEREVNPRSRPEQSGQLIDLVRWLDLCLAASLLLFVAPLMGLVALIIKLSDGGPVFFGQVRIGEGGREFRCWKFRSMVVDAQAKLESYLASHPEAHAEWEAGHKLRRDPRITSFGRFLRSSSIDELPQLLNVIRGDMSLVGPRPIVHAEIKKYGRYFEHYCSVRPGITGLWQVMGRNGVTYRRRVAIDVTFTRVRSLQTYIRILIMTVPAVLSRSGV
jgi:exopolysaccharide production protein ExoY